MKVYCAIDFFFENWNHRTKRKLWLGVLPYVNGKEELAEWVKNLSNNGIQVNYELVSNPQMFANPEDLIPVPLSSDTDLKVTLTDIAPIHLKRTQNFIVSHPEDFRSLNVTKPLTPLEEADEDGGIRHVAQGTPYVVSLVNQIREMHKEYPDTLPNWLRLAFEIGQRRKFNDAVMSAIGPYISAEHSADPNSANYEVTNLHNLAGLMVEVPVDLPRLKRVTQVEIEFLVDGTSVQTLQLNHDVDSKLALTRFFSTLKDQFQNPKIEFSWLDDIRYRVYALPEAQLFPLQHLPGINDVTLFRRPRGGEGRAQQFSDLNTGTMNRLIVKYDVTGKNQHPMTPESISFKPVSTFDLVCQPFLNYPTVLDNGDDLIGLVMELSPHPHDLHRWRRLVDELYAENTSVEGLTLFKHADNGVFSSVVPDWVGLFKLPWHPGTHPVVLMYVRTDVKGNLLGVFSRDDQRQFSLDLTGTDMETDPFGPRWEVHLTGDVAPLEFDGLLVDSDMEDLDKHSLIVSGYSEGEYQFELAQSARRIEAVARVAIEESDQTDKPSEIDAEVEYRADFVNYNAAIYAESWVDTKEILNDASESTADFEEKRDGQRCYTFHVRFTRSTSARQRMKDVKKFYSDLYQRLGQDRSLKFDLEHTYGTQLSMTDALALPTPLDEPIKHPADVGEHTQDKSTRFIEVDYTRNGDTEFVSLVFNRNILSSEWRGDESSDVLLQSHIEAWQSVAEIAYAEQITVTCQAYRFNFHVALAAETSTVGDGLTPIGQPIVIDVTNTVRSELYNWLNQSDEVQSTEWRTQLSIPGEPLWKTSHVIRFYLTVTRSKGLYPDRDESWEVVSPKTRLPAGGADELVDRNGYVVDRLTGDAIQEQLRVWMGRLRQVSSYLSPSNFDPDNREEIERYRGLLHRGPKDSQIQPDAASWIIPDGNKKPDGPVSLSVVPIGFRPFNRSSFLGDKTDQLIFAFFHALQSVLNLESQYWAHNFDQEKWWKFFVAFDEKSQHGEKFKATYQKLCEHVAALLYPIPDTRRPVGNQQAIHEVIVEASAALKSGEIGNAVRERFKRRFKQLPSVFAATKALIYYRLTGVTLNEAAPPDFYSIKLIKKITESDQLGKEPGVTDTYAVSFDNGLVTNEPQWFGFLEYLDDKLYDNDFFVTDLQLTSAENLLEDESGSLSLLNNELFIPAEFPQQILHSDTAKPIYLPSRRLVQKPVLVTAGLFESTESAEKFAEQFPINQNRDFSAFTAGIGRSPESQAQPVKRIACKGTGRSTQIDDMIVSYVFTIRGDEESRMDWLNSLVNDAFLVRLDSGGVAVDIKEADEVSDVVAQVFKLLEEPDKVLYSKEAVNLLNINTIDFVDSVVRNTSEVEDPKDPYLRFRIRATEESRPEIVLEGAPLGKAVEVHLFQVADQGSEDLLYLWINLELNIWQPQYMTLQQSRNFGTPERRFEPAFGMLSLEESSRTYPRQAIIKSLSMYPPVLIDKQAYSAKDWVQVVFVDATQLLSEIGDTGGNLSFNVNITLSELIAPIFPTQKPGEKLRHDTVELGSFPLKNIRISDQVGWTQLQNEEFWFPTQGDRYRVDIEWRRKDTNDIFFRLEALEVRAR